MSHTEGRLEAVTDCPGRCCWHIQKVGNTDEFNRITSLEMGEADARRLVACWNEHDGLVHDNARLYQSLQGEMQGRLKAEQERDEALAAFSDLYTEVMVEFGYCPDPVKFEAILAKHKVTG